MREAALRRSFVRNLCSQTADYGYHLVFSFTPVRSDGEAGAAVFSRPSEPVLPPLPTVDAATVTGQNVEDHH
eukprot:4377085-Pyramimonas_sp.AAC.1